jgi:hypothetical protein
VIHLERSIPKQILAISVILIGWLLLAAGIAIIFSSGSFLSWLYLFITQVPGFPLTCEASGIDLPSVLGNVGSGVLFSLTGVVDIFSGWSLWTKHQWSRILLIIIFSIAAFFGLYNIVSYGFSTVLALFPGSIPSLAINLFIVIYLIVYCKQ